MHLQSIILKHFLLFIVQYLQKSRWPVHMHNYSRLHKYLFHFTICQSRKSDFSTELSFTFQAVKAAGLKK
jgi:hypothetical protein